MSRFPLLLLLLQLSAVGGGRQLALGAERLRFDADTEGSLAASVYSLPGSFFSPETAGSLLAAVRALAPRRRLLVLADPPMRLALAARARALGVDLLETHAAYSPWPRDPFSLVHQDGRVVALVRPNLQAGREEDATMGIALVEGLPPALDAAWGSPRWARAAVPFHNGQVLLTPREAWVSLHTLEPRILEILGLRRVPVESFATAAGIDRYLAAARRGAAELETLYGRPVRFVHPLPETGAEAARGALLGRIGGGAGFDLDSLLTLLPAANGGTRALVADVGAGRELLGRLPAADFQALARGYDLAPPPARLPAELAAAQAAARPAALAGFLDLVAEHLRSQGLAVDRLPLFFVPTALLADRVGVTHLDFLIGWNNVVVERREGTTRAEGFASLLPTADAGARDVFARAGVHLDLLPPLVHSVVLNGGYRCASNHLREPASTSIR